MFVDDFKKAEEVYKNNTTNYRQFYLGLREAGLVETDREARAIWSSFIRSSRKEKEVLAQKRVLDALIPEVLNHFINHCMDKISRYKVDSSFSDVSVRVAALLKGNLLKFKESFLQECGIEENSHE